MGDASLRGQVALSQATVSPQLTKDCACFGFSIHGDMIPDHRSEYRSGIGSVRIRIPPTCDVPPPLSNPLFGWYWVDINRIPGSRLDVTPGHRLGLTPWTLQPRTLNPQVSGSNPEGRTNSLVSAPYFSKSRPKWPSGSQKGSHAVRLRRLVRRESRMPISTSCCFVALRTSNSRWLINRNHSV